MANLITGKIELQHCAGWHCENCEKLRKRIDILSDKLLEANEAWHLLNNENCRFKSELTATKKSRKKKKSTKALNQ